MIKKEKAQRGEGNYLEVQPGLHIHYKVFEHLKPFARRRNTGEQPGIKRSASQPKEPAIPSQVPHSSVDSDLDAEVELDVPDGVEELGDRGRTATNESRDTEQRPITFVLLHGFLCGTFSWDEVVGSLRQYGTVLCFDRPGFGLSSRPVEGDEVWSNCSLEGLARCAFKGCYQHEHTYVDEEIDSPDFNNNSQRTNSNPFSSWVNPYSDLYSAHIIMRLLHHIFDHNNKAEDEHSSLSKSKGIRRHGRTRAQKRNILLVGHSLGGRIALNTFNLFQQSFRGLVLVNAALFSSTAAIPGYCPNLFKQVGSRIYQMLPRMIPSRLAYFDFANALNKHQRQNYQHIFDCENWQKALQLWGMHHFSDNDFFPETILRGISIPVLVIAGDHDQVVDISESRRIIALLKNGQQPPSMYAEFQQTGHCPMEERPKLFVSVVEAFLDKFFIDKSLDGRKYAYFGSTPSLYAEYRNQFNDPFKEGCLLMDNCTGEVRLITPPGGNFTLEKLSKSQSFPDFPKDVNEISH